MHIKKNIKNAIQEIYTLANDTKNIEDQLNMYQFYASSCWHNYTETFSHKEFEEKLITISENIIDIPINNSFDDNHVLHVMTEAYEVGGHTRVVENWIKSADENQSILINNKNLAIPTFLEYAVSSKNGNIIINEAKTFLEKANFLATIASKYKYIVLHHHPHDILPLLAFGTSLFIRPVFFYNHADHIWGCGYSVCSLVMEIQMQGITHSVKYRGIPKEKTKFIGIPLDLELNIQSNDLNEKIIITMANAYKFKSIVGLNFQNFIDSILSKDINIKYYIIGVSSDDPDWITLRKKYSNQLFLLGELVKDKVLPILSTATLYVDSFPIGSGTSMIEAMRLGIPSIAYDSILQNVDSYRKYSYQSIDDMTTEAFRILSLSKQTRDELVNEQKKKLLKWHSLENFSFRISEVCSEVCSEVRERLILTGNIKYDAYITKYNNFLYHSLNQNKFIFDGSIVSPLSPMQIENVIYILSNNNLLEGSAYLHENKISFLGFVLNGNRTLFQQLFIETHDGFTERDSIKLNYPSEIQEGINLTDFSNIKSLRFDPLNDFAIVKINRIEVNKQLYTDKITSNAFYHEENIYYFFTDDPQFHLNMNTFSNIDEIMFDVEYLKYGEDALKEFPNILFKILGEKEQQVQYWHNLAHSMRIKNRIKKNFKKVNLSTKYLMKIINYYIIKTSNFFNKQYYINTYLQSEKQDIDPVKHYLDIGWKLGYNPSEKFTTNLYLELNPDVKEANINPLLHYLKHGKWQGRKPNHYNETLIRKIYNKSKLLRIVVAIGKKYKQKFSLKKIIKTSSSQNINALHYLLSRRNEHIKHLLSSNNIIDYNLPEIDISVVTYNSEKWINSFFSSLLKQSYPLSKINLFFIDHSLVDKTYNKLLKKKNQLNKFNTFKVFKQENKGFGYGHNKGIKESSSDFILVTNIDIVFKEDSITSLVNIALLDEKKQYASWECRQIPYEHPKYYDPVTLETNWSSHACILLRRVAYEEVGGYEPEIFMYAEDVELSYRFRAYGWHLKYCPDAVVEHYTYEEANEIKPIQFQGSTLGNAFLRFRYGNTQDKLAILPLFTALLLQPERFPGSRKVVLNNISILIKKAKYFMNFEIKNKDFYAPFREFDYDFIRDGSFYHISIPSHEKLVSVIVRTYRGRDNFLQQCLTSILNQTYKNIEVLVVEDGGDTIKSLVSKFSKILNIRYFNLEKVGRSATGNFGLKNSTGDYCIFLDDDDLFFADHIEILVNSLNSNDEASASYSLAYEVATEQIDKLHYQEAEYRTGKVFYQDFDYRVLTDHNYFPIQTVLFKRSLYLQRGGFNEELIYLEDWNLWLRYAYNNKFIYNQKTTSLYRVPMKQDISQNRQKLLDDAYYIAKEDTLKRNYQ